MLGRVERPVTHRLLRRSVPKIDYEATSTRDTRGHLKAQHWQRSRRALAYRPGPVRSYFVRNMWDKEPAFFCSVTMALNSSP